MISFLKNKILGFWLRLNSNYWFIPSAMTCGAVFLFVICLKIDLIFDTEWLTKISWLYSNDPDGARAVLSTIAGSMITVAGVTFSMTLLSFSHASSQIGPRLLSGFMDDRGNQITLGILISTFIYCLLVLGCVHGSSDTQNIFIPQISMIVSFAMAIFSISALIYFIHHVPKTISMTLVVRKVGDEFLEQINSIYPEEIGLSEQKIEDETNKTKKDEGLKKHSFTKNVFSKTKGYIQYIDSEGVLDFTTQKDVLIELLKRPGDFVCQNMPIAIVYSDEAIKDDQIEEAANSLVVGNQRSKKQDIIFSGQLLVEVAVRALSPGINDPYTAVECLNQLQAGISNLLQRNQPDNKRYDEKGFLRIVSKPVDFNEHINLLFNQLRPHACKDLMVTRAFFDALLFLIEVSKTDSHKENLRDQARVLFESAKNQTNNNRDLELIKESYKMAVDS